MELDMIAFITTETPDRAVDFWRPMVVSKLHHWCNHHDLHAWMTELYRSKGGSIDPFELTSVALTYRDLDELEALLWTMELTVEFDDWSGDECDESEDHEFIRKARAAIGEGKTVFYVAGRRRRARAESEVMQSRSGVS